MQTRSLVEVQPTKQQLVDYTNALISVNSYAYSIINQQMPVLSNSPAQYSAFVQQFTPARQHVLFWSDSIFVKILTIPSVIISQADLFNMEETMIEAYLGMLIGDGTNQSAKNGLESALSMVIKMVNGQLESIQTLENQLEQFATDIQADASTLSTMAAESLAMVTGDKDKIQSLNSDIQDLSNLIKTDQKLLTVSEIGVGVSLFVGLVGVVACFIPGAQLAGAALVTVAVAGEATSIAFTVIESEKIQALQETIDHEQQQIASINQDVILLQACSQQFNDLFTANAAAQKALVAIKLMWTGMLDVVKTINSELVEVKSEVASSQYAEALSLFQTAEHDWSELVNFSGRLADIDYSWQDATGNWHKYGDKTPDLDASKVEVIPARAA